jgi:two-component system cell cycle response regulator
MDELERYIEHFAVNNQLRINGRVLLVEDKDWSATLYSEILERMGLQIEHCKNAEQAIGSFAARNFDLVVADYALAVAMPDYSLIRAVRDYPGKRSKTPVLVIANYDDAAHKAEILRLGASDFVCKPVLEEELEMRAFNMIKMQKLSRRLESQYAVMRDIATRDPLTSLYNRNSLHEIMIDMLGDANDSGQHLSLMVVDIDHFNQINETKGHKTGDHVLQQVAKVLQGFCRIDDLVARIGGEEFAVALPRIGLAEATARGEAIRASIAELTPSDIPVTASIGVAELVYGEDFDELYRRAGSAMYCAKLAGRNRVVAAGECAGWEERNSFNLRRVRRESRASVGTLSTLPQGNSLHPSSPPANF